MKETKRGRMKRLAPPETPAPPPATSAAELGPLPVGWVRPTVEEFVARGYKAENYEWFFERHENELRAKHRAAAPPPAGPLTPDVRRVVGLPERPRMRPMAVPVTSAEMPTSPASPGAMLPPGGASTMPDVRRVVGLPARPRLRVSYWFEGDSLACEAVLMDEKRDQLRRSRIGLEDPTVSRVFSYFATRLVNELRAAGVLVAAPSSPRPPSSSEPDPSPSPSGSSPSSGAEPGSSSSSSDDPDSSPSSSDEPGPATPRG